MKKITNKNVQKEYRSKVITLVIGIVLLVISFACQLWEQKTIDEANKKMTDLNSIIVSKGEKADKKAYLDAQTIPYKFAVYDDTTDSYYIVADSKYMYIVYMTTADFNKLNKKDIEKNPIRIEGVTKQTTKDIKELAIDAYNEGIEEEEKISLADFNNYFGEVYLDLTVTDNAVATLPVACFILTLIFGIIVFIIGLYGVLNFQRTIRKLDATMIDDLNNEMEDKEAFYYQRAHLYLTRNYIINFGGSFRVIPYKDILWMYKFEQRTNGIKTAQALKVLTNSGKTYAVANMDIVTKKSKAVFEEIWETIYNKNNKIVLGYTKENIQAMKEKVKEIKKSK